jgi:hypothetical protein
MRTASRLLALLVVLGMARQAAAASFEIPPTKNDFTVRIAGHTFGLHEPERFLGIHFDTTLHLGPLGRFEVPFTAIQGLIAFGIVLAASIALPVILIVRRNKSKPHFSIRDLLWLTSLCAALMGWCIDRRNLEAQLDAAYSQALDRADAPLSFPTREEWQRIRNHESPATQPSSNNNERDFQEASLHNP